MEKMNLHSLVYRNYLKGALIPIFVIEIALLILYFGINFYIAKRNRTILLEEATLNIQEIASREVKGLNQQLHNISDLARLMQKDHERFFSNTNIRDLANGEPRFKVHENGSYYKVIDNGGGSLWYSSTTRIGPEEALKAQRSEAMDPLLKNIVDTSPIVTQAYFNSWDDMNRLYPFMPDAPEQYGSAINMEDYNFYYEADAEHNPGRGPAWTSAYLDPAGQGWMISVVVPVYRNDFLEGVSGLDVTIDSFVQNVLELQFPWNAATLMMDKQGVMLAMQPKAEEILGIKELGKHTYTENILETIEKPDEFNLLKNPDQTVQESFSRLFSGKNHIGTITLNGVEYMVSQEIVEETGWHMINLIDKEHVFAPITQLKKLSNRIGIAAITAMGLFYGVFFVFLQFNSRRISNLIAHPIVQLSEMTRAFAKERMFIQSDPSSVSEINRLTEDFEMMSKELISQTNALVEAQMKAEESSKAKSEFLTTMSHEIRTPLNAVINGTYLLEHTDLNEEQKADVRTIAASSKSLLSLVNDTLDFAKIEAGEMQIDPHDFSLQEVIQDLHLLFAPTFKEKGIELLIPELSSELPPFLVGDSNRLRQMLINLLSNALKFTEKGKVSVGVKRIESPPNDDRIHLQFSVTDSGIGISAEIMNKLFTPFTQADSSTSRKYGGTGLGLSIVKLLTELMDGTVDIKSTPGVGSRFCLKLPFHIGQGDEHENHQKDDRPHLEGLRVLAVDDAPINLMIIEHILELEAAIPTICSSGEEAIDLIKQNPDAFDLILMDVQMPGMSGRDATIYIRQELKLDLPIIALTGGVTNFEKEKALDAGMNAFLTKPVKPADLAHTIAKLLPSCPPSETTSTSNPAWPIIQGIDSDEAANLTGDDPSFLKEMLNLFIEVHQGIAEQLQQKLDQNDYKAAAALAHKTCGQAASIGAVPLSITARALENAINESSPDLSGFVSQFIHAYTELDTAVSDWMAAQKIIELQEGE